MAFVILSTGSIARSRLRTLRVRTLVLGLGVVLILTLAGGLRLGYRFGQADAATAAISTSLPFSSLAEYIAQPGGRALIDRIGALSGRVFQLETEARGLAARIGLMQQDSGPPARGESRAAGADRDIAPSVAGPSGGPLLPVSGDREPAMAEFPVEEIDLDRLDRGLDEVSTTLALLATATTPMELDGMAFPGRLPISGRRISSGFGSRVDPFTRRLARHTGIDIPAPHKTPIKAAGGGRVTFAGYRAAYGNTVEIDHGNGLKTRYAHASRLLVRQGQVVLPEQTIAIVGSTGRSTGAHLHFEVLRNGRPVEPRNFLRPSGA